jgi:hypothetical protein
MFQYDLLITETQDNSAMSPTTSLVTAASEGNNVGGGGEGKKRDVSFQASAAV